MISSPNPQDDQHLLSLLEDALDFAVYRVAVDPESPFGGRVLMVSPSIKDIVGIRDMWRFETWFENLHPDDRERVVEANRCAWEQCRRYDQSARFFNPVKGEWVWVHTISTPAYDAQGRLQHFTGVIVDITEQKRAEAALIAAQSELEQRVVERTGELRRANIALLAEIEQRRQAEENLLISQELQTEVFDNSPLQLFVIEVLPDGRFRVLKTNPAHQLGSGVSRDQIEGKLVEEVVIPEVAAAVNRHYRDCIAAGHAIEYEESGPVPYWDVNNVHAFRTTLAPVRDASGRIIRLVGASADITGQKRAEQIIMDQARQEAVAAERNRLARELHDAVTQTLFSTTLIADVLPAIWERDPDEGREQLDELRELTRGALAEMRTLLMELRPAAMESTELSELLRQLAAAFIGRARVPVALRVERCPRLPVEVKVAFYRIAQEALHNIAKHADAGQVSLSLVCGREVELEVSDDGRGFAVDQLPAGRLGLSILRERAAQIGARIEISSKVGAGSTVRVNWVNQISSEGQP